MTPRTPISDDVADEVLIEWRELEAERAKSHGWDNTWSHTIIMRSIATALARGERIRELERYIELLWHGSQAPVALAHVHGWRCPVELVEQGKAFRKRLGLPESYDTAALGAGGRE